MSSSGVVPGGIFSTRNVNGRFRSVESMAMTTWISSYVAPLMSLVDLSLVCGWKCGALRSHVWESSNIGGYEAEVHPSQNASQNEEGV